MSFFLSALPALFSSPFVRDTLGSIAGGLWNAVKQNAATAANDFVSNTTQSVVKSVNDRIKPLQGKRLAPFDDGTDENDWGNEDPDPDPVQPFERPVPKRRPIGRKRVKR